jgi:uncharacterized membrane protein YedE/YeeE
MKQRVFFLMAGAGFGYVLIKSGVSNFDVIHEMFLMQSIHLYGVLALAVGISFLAIQALRALKVKALLDGTQIDYSNNPLEKGHITGGLLAGAGWALTGACPGPALAQIGFGTMAGLFTVAGIFLGTLVFGWNRK